MYTQVYGQQAKKTGLKSGGGVKRKISSVNVIQRIPRNIAYQKPNLNELKYVDTVQQDENFVTVPSAGFLINGLVQGAGQFQRIGNKIAMKSLRIRGQIVNLSTNIQTMVRIVIVYDKQSNGAIPNSSTVLATRDTAGASTNTAYSFLNMDYVERFTIIRDYAVTLPSVSHAAGVLTNVGFESGQTPTGESMLNVDLFIKLKGLLALYKGATSAIADIATGGLYMYCLTQAGNNTWTSRNTMRLRYDDN